MSGLIVMWSIPSSNTVLVGLLLVTLSTCCFGLALEPTEVSVSCPNYNCTLTWDAPENVTSSDDITYTAEFEVWEGDNSTYTEIPGCVDIRQTECNLVSVVNIDSLADAHFVAVSAVVNGNQSVPVEVSFFPNLKAILERPEVMLIFVEATSFTVHVHAPMSPYEDPKTGKLYRTDELPPFQKKGFWKAKYGHSSTLYIVEPNNKQEEIKEENGPTIDQEIVFSDLNPYTSYRLEVLACFGFIILNPGKKPTVVTVTTLEDVPSQGPTLLSIVRKSPNCSSPDISPVIVSWKPPPPEHHNGQLTHYSIRYMYPGHNFSLASVKNCSVADSSLVLVLLRWQAYEFAVQACNAVGCAESPHKTLFNLQAIRKGSKCTNISVDLTNDHPLVISWLPPQNLTECIMKYLVTIEPDNKKNPTIIEMVHRSTTLQINETIPAGRYVVAVKPFIRSGFDSATPGEEAKKEFMIENKTITNHLILPLVITFSVLFCAVLVAIIICAKWILRPFDFQLEKTRALKVARAYPLEPTRYRQTEQEVYDPLPGSRRSSRTSTASRLSLTATSRRMLLSDSSSVGNRLASHQNGEALQRLASHTEDPREDDALLESVTYSSVSEQSSVREPLSPGSSGWGGNSNRRYPMLTIEVPADNSSPRVVRWKARGLDPVYSEEEDPFDLPRADDFDGSDVPSRSSSSSAANSKGDFPSISTSSGMSDPRPRLNYASLVSQTSETSESGFTPPIIDVIQPDLFAPVNEEPSDNELNESSEETPYAQIANNASNISASFPISSSLEGGHIDPYAQIANSETREPHSPLVDGRHHRAGSDDSEEYTQIARENRQFSPEIREIRTDSNSSESYVQLSNCNSPSPMLPRGARTSNGHLESTSAGADADSNSSRLPLFPQGVDRGRELESHGRLSNQLTIVDNSPSPERRNVVSEPDANTLHSTPSKASSSHNHEHEGGNSDISEPYMQLKPPNANATLRSSPASVRRENGRSSPEPYMQLLPLGSLRPNKSPVQARGRGLRHDHSESKNPYRSVRVPIIHAEGSPLLPSRALDVRDSDSDTSDTDSQDSFPTHNHDSVEDVGSYQLTNETIGRRANPTEELCPNAAAESTSKLTCQSDSTAAETDIQNRNGHGLHNGETSGYVAPSSAMLGAAFVNAQYTSQS